MISVGWLNNIYDFSPITTCSFELTFRSNIISFHATINVRELAMNWEDIGNEIGDQKHFPRQVFFRNRLHGEKPKIPFGLTWKVISSGCGDRQPHLQNVKTELKLCLMCLGVRSGPGWGSADSWWWRPWSRSASTPPASSSPSSGLSPRESLHLMNSRMTSESTHSWNYPFTDFLSSDLLCTRTVPGCRERSGHIMITPEYKVLTLWSTCCPTSGPGSSPGWWTATSAWWLTRWSQTTWPRGTASSGLAPA